MPKDPAFLFYSKDWLQGTAKYFPAEKGVFIDLLSHHHQDGYLPPDKKRLAKICGLSEDEFNKIWEAIKEEFYEEEGKLYNEKLVSVMNDRGEHGEMRAIVGTFGQFMKKLHLPPDMKKRISESFDYKEFIGIDRAKLSNCISIWIRKWITNDGNGNEDGNGNNNTQTKKSTKKNNLKQPIIIPFNTMPKREDFGELPAEYIFSAIGVVKIIQSIVISEETVKEFWNVFKIQNLTGHNYYPNESRVYSHFINVIKIQKFTDGTGKASGTERTVNSLLSKDKRTKW